MNHQTDLPGAMDRMLALATRFQDEGQVNLSKLLEATAYGRLRRAAWQTQPPITVANMESELDAVLSNLRQQGLNTALIARLEAGRKLLGEQKVPLIDDAPDVFVCRVCGYASLSAAPDHCPDCGAWPGYFRKFIGTFNGDNTEPTNPFEVLALLRSNAQALNALVADLSPEVLNRRPSAEAWPLHTHVVHFQGAQETLASRVNLMLTQENPELVVLALYDMASQAPPSSTAQVLTDYLDSRARFIAQMEQVPLKDYWRTGWHQEFGKITIIRQMAYMANHEQTHLPEIEALRKANLAQSAGSPG